MHHLLNLNSVISVCAMHKYFSRSEQYYCRFSAYEIMFYIAFSSLSVCSSFNFMLGLFQGV